MNLPHVYTESNPEIVSDQTPKRRVGRPSRTSEVDEICRLTGASRESVRNFFHRPGRLSSDMRQSIATAVAITGYQPVRRAKGALTGVPIGYQMPKFWSVPSPVMELQFRELLGASQSAGAHLVPFAVDPRVSGVTDVVGGTNYERGDTSRGLQGWYREYANMLAPAAYAEVMRERSVQMFVVNDVAVDDPRLEMLASEGIPHVALGLPRWSHPDGHRRAHPYVETDNRAGIVDMARILREAGCRTFGHVGFTDDASHVTDDRRDAVRAAVGRAVPSFGISYLESLSPARHPQLSEWLRANDVDAVLCDSDALAYTVHLAGVAVGRSPVQDPHALDDGPGRPLLLTGNDNSYHRTWVKPAERWMTMEPPERQKMAATVELLEHLRAGGGSAATSILVAPRILRWAEGGQP